MEARTLISVGWPRECRHCKLNEPVVAFYPKRGLTCKPCHAKQAREWRAANPERARAIGRRHYQKSSQTTRRGWVLKRHFGMTLEQYNEQIAKQGGKCALCLRVPTEQPKRKLAVDHCHKTNTIRGLLCGECNRGLGLFRDNVYLLKRAIKYLNSARGKNR